MLGARLLATVLRQASALGLPRGAAQARRGCRDWLERSRRQGDHGPEPERVWPRARRLLPRHGGRASRGRFNARQACQVILSPAPDPRREPGAWQGGAQEPARGRCGRFQGSGRRQPDLPEQEDSPVAGLFPGSPATKAREKGGQGQDNPRHHPVLPGAAGVCPSGLHGPEGGHSYRGPAVGGDGPPCAELQRDGGSVGAAQGFSHAEEAELGGRGAQAAGRKDRADAGRGDRRGGGGAGSSGHADRRGGEAARQGGGGVHGQ
mmetsp:Transcript_33392/g.99466  ORF Transcript_33392/g.99466 Transcript_33392/m.99466 type:complete len:263 (+) Transcript_33392:127-915(+)